MLPSDPNKFTNIQGTEALSRKIKRALTEVDKQPALSESVRLDWGDDAWEEPEPETEGKKLKLFI